jgi:hypothetical protein
VMRYGAIISGLLHVGILILVIIGLPGILQSERVEMVPISVEVVSIEELSKLQEKKTPPKPKAKKPPPKKPDPPKPSKKPPPPPPTKKPPPPEPRKPEPKPPEPKPPEVKPEPVPKPKPKADPAPKPKAKPALPKKPETQVAVKTPPAPKPKRKPKPPPPKPDEFQSLLKNLAKDKRAAEKARADAPAKVVEQVEDKPKRSALQARMMAASLAQSVNRQVTPCWSIPAGAKDAANMSVAIRIRLNADGTFVAAPKIEDTRRLGSDTSFRAVAESALRALRDQRCAPLKLPYDQYDLWKDIIFTFDPKEALGQ